MPGDITESLRESLVEAITQTELRNQDARETIRRESIMRHDELLALLNERDRQYRQKFDDMLTLSTERRRALEQASDERDARYEQRFLGQEVAVGAALNSAKEAVTKAEIATERRFEGVNEFRQQLADQTSTFIPRSEAAVLIAALTDKVAGLDARLTSINERVLTNVASIGGEQVGGDRINARFDSDRTFGIAVTAVIITAVLALISIGSLIYALSQ